MSKTDIAGIFPEEAVMWLVSAARTGEAGSRARIFEIDRVTKMLRQKYPAKFSENSPASFIQRKPPAKRTETGLHWRAKLTNEDVELIRQLHEGGMGVTAIAKKFSVHKSHISRVTRYRAR